MSDPSLSALEINVSLVVESLSPTVVILERGQSMSILEVGNSLVLLGQQVTLVAE